jgi:predicted nucleic acid-binding protein
MDAAGADCCAPYLIDAEVLHVLRRHARRAGYSVRCAQAVELWRRYPVDRWPHEDLLHRAWELRANFTAYDAIYLALAESLGATLLTCDRRLAAPGHGARVEVV